ncbi:uncharacterized protein CEXT_482501 [Caerostris extrusa]|uniref:Uncharacterized protein n=1 Tax=Caerostris extrusa TaxID=172846 RepID=A0AAV4R1Z6_CAEEX|nr:uncharacterized protein CEXT_482501 [Caerostris extrusa]
MKLVMKFFVILGLVIATALASSDVTPPTLPLQNYSAVAVEQKFNGGCQGNKTYDYFADCGERCQEYPKYCSAEKVLRCGCLKGYVQIDSTFLSPCLKPEDCPQKAPVLKDKNIMKHMKKMQKHTLKAVKQAMKMEASLHSAENN